MRMEIRIREWSFIRSAAGFALCCALAAPAAAQPAAGAGAESGESADALLASVEEIVVTGTRRQNRTVLDSLSPIDVISPQELENQGFSELDDLLRTAVPSYQVNSHPIDDASTLVRPAKLRGLTPDQTLVLVNGKRRHRGAVLSWVSDGPTEGSQGPDLTPIPAAALAQAEVLRDGASAQYGSDAIAGVLNFILKDDARGGSLELRRGRHYQGDGETWKLVGNFGLPIGRLGFVNTTIETWGQKETVRSVQRRDVARLLGEGLTGIMQPAQRWGSPVVDDAWNFVVNSGLQLTRNSELYMFGNYSRRQVDGGFYYRNPDTRNGVFASGSGCANLMDGSIVALQADENCAAAATRLGIQTETRPFRLIGDLDASDGFDCQTEYRSLATRLAADTLSAVSADSRCFVMNELHPAGFTPRFGGEVLDSSLVAGVRGELASGLRWDASFSQARSRADCFIYNTVNASLGPDQPEGGRFDPGAYIQRDTGFNLDFALPLTVPYLNSPLNIAAGFEWREERFAIENGGELSWRQGPLVQQGFTAASNGFPGFSPSTQGKFDRSNIAFYTDLEADITPELQLGLALRHEDFDSFGGTTNGKIAARYAVNSDLSLRATASTGFRAPTPAQRNARNTSTTFVEGTTDLIELGTISPIDPLAVRFGGRELEPEESLNFTVGMHYDLSQFVSGLAFTLDYFRIDLDDRIALSQEFRICPDGSPDSDGDGLCDIAQALVDDGIRDARVFQQFRFFTNAFDTETQGIEFVATWRGALGPGEADVSLAWSWVDTEVVRWDPAIIERLRRLEIEEQLPEQRGVLNANYRLGAWRALLRLSYWGGWLHPEQNFQIRPDTRYGAEWLLDAEIAWEIQENTTLMLGAANLFDGYPDEDPYQRSAGNRYPEHSPFGFNGGLWYLRLRYAW